MEVLSSLAGQQSKDTSNGTSNDTPNDHPNGATHSRTSYATACCATAYSQNWSFCASLLFLNRMVVKTNFIMGKSATFDFGGDNFIWKKYLCDNDGIDVKTVKVCIFNWD